MIDHQYDTIRPLVYTLEVDSGGGPAAEASGLGVQLDGSKKQLIEDLIGESQVNEFQAHKSLPTPN